MSVLLAGQVETHGPWAALARLNPISKLVIITVITLGLLISLDATTASVILVAEVAALPFAGLRARSVLMRAGVLLAVAASITLVNALFSQNTDGVVLFQFGGFGLSTGGLAAAAAVGLRVLALSLPAAVLLASTDPAELADGLQQHLRVPARYAMVLLTGLRMLPLLADDWRELSAARRARGLSASNPVAAVRAAVGRISGLLIVALRRGMRMAAAMQARGFDPYAPRTYARISRLMPADLIAMLASVAVVLLATVLAIRAGHWAFALKWPF